MESLVSACVSAQQTSSIARTASLPAAVCLRFLRETCQVHDAGLKSFGLLVAEPDAPGAPFRATDVVFLDARRNRRNEPDIRAAFEAQGDYFRHHDDAGFVADPADVLDAYRRIDSSGREIVAMFHSHRRQPPNFSWIDYRLHNPAFAWHLIVSFHRGPVPELQAFRVDKNGAEIGISADDDRQGSEVAYPGPEVIPLSVVVDGTVADVQACAAAVQAAGPGLLAGCRLT
jgi:proteasome lid subunit RPN8/RPN11